MKKVVTRDELIEEVYNQLNLDGYNVSMTQVRRIITTADDIRKSLFIQGETIDFEFCSIEPKVRRVNNNLGTNPDGFTVKISGNLYKKYRDQCVQRIKDMEKDEK